MFRKKAKEAPAETVVPAEEPKEEVVERTCPDIDTAVSIIRDTIRDYALCICNISRQRKEDICSCLDYLSNYVREHAEIDSIIDSIDNEELIQLSKTFERNGYTITINIERKK